MVLSPFFFSPKERKGGGGGGRPLKKVVFDTTGFLGAQNLTQEQRDSRQNLYDNRSKEQCFEAICEHITAV